MRDQEERITELLKANNREVERRRKAEARVKELEGLLRKLGKWEWVMS